MRGEAMPGYTGVRLGTEEGGEQKSDFRAIGGGAYGGDEAWGNPDLLVRYAHTQVTTPSKSYRPTLLTRAFFFFLGALAPLLLLALLAGAGFAFAGCVGVSTARKSLPVLLLSRKSC